MVVYALVYHLTRAMVTYLHVASPGRASPRVTCVYVAPPDDMKLESVTLASFYIRRVIVSKLLLCESELDRIASYSLSGLTSLECVAV
jgi:hypothetical protein